MRHEKDSRPLSENHFTIFTGSLDAPFKSLAKSKSKVFSPVFTSTEMPLVSKVPNWTGMSFADSGFFVLPYMKSLYPSVPTGAAGGSGARTMT